MEKTPPHSRYHLANFEVSEPGYGNCVFTPESAKDVAGDGAGAVAVSIVVDNQNNRNHINGRKKGQNYDFALFYP